MMIKRNAAFDLVKLIAMFMVVLGHLLKVIPQGLLVTMTELGIFARMGIKRDEKGVMMPLQISEYDKKVKELRLYLDTCLG